MADSEEQNVAVPIMQFSENLTNENYDSFSATAKPSSVSQPSNENFCFV